MGTNFMSFANREGHAMSIWPTPKSAEYHAQQIKRNVDACEHPGERDE
jgi:hypothetical protein